MPDPLQPAQPVAARGVRRDRIDVAHPVQGLDEERPERGEDDQEQLARHASPVDEHRERDQGHGGNRSQELQRNANRAVGQAAGAHRQAQRDGQQRGQQETEGPALHRLADRVPEVRRDQLLGQRQQHERGRGEVGARQDADPGHRLQEEEDRQHREQAQRAPPQRQLAPDQIRLETFTFDLSHPSPRIICSVLAMEGRLSLLSQGESWIFESRAGEVLV